MRSLQEHIRRFEAVQLERSVWQNYWAEIRDNVSPDTANFQGIETVGVRNRFDLDMTSEAASIYLAGTMHAWLANPGTVWFRLTLVDEDMLDEEGAIWLEEASAKVLRRLESPLSRFHEQMPPYLRQLADFGTSGMFTGLNDGLPEMEVRPLVELFISESKRGRRDTLFRKWRPTAYEIVTEFGDRAPERVRKRYAAGNFMDRFDLLEVIEPNPDGRPDALAGRNLPVSSVVICLDSKEIIDSGGYHENPVAVGVWFQRAGEVYGRGPGMQALPHQTMVTRAERTIVRGAEKIVDPPLEVPDDGAVGRIKMQPNSINYTKRDLWGRRSVITPINTGARPDLGEFVTDRQRAMIRLAYLVPYIETAQDPKMTATQVLKLEEQTLRLVAPFLGGQFSQLLEPVIFRSFMGMLRAGRLGRPPESLTGKPLRVDWESPMVKAARLGEVRGLLRLVSEVGAQMHQYDPDVMDNVDFDTAFREASRWLGVPRNLLNAMRTVKELRDARNRAAEQMAQRQAMAQEAAALQSVGQASAAFAGAQATANENEFRQAA